MFGNESSAKKSKLKDSSGSTSHNISEKKIDAVIASLLPKRDDRINRVFKESLRGKSLVLENLKPRRESLKSTARAIW